MRHAALLDHNNKLQIEASEANGNGDSSGDPTPMASADPTPSMAASTVKSQNLLQTPANLRSLGADAFFLVDAIDGNVAEALPGSSSSGKPSDEALSALMANADSLGSIASSANTISSLAFNEIRDLSRMQSEVDGDGHQNGQNGNGTQENRYYIGTGAANTPMLADANTYRNKKNLVIEVEEDGCVKRVGGIGDVLAGVLTLFCSWQQMQSQNTKGGAEDLDPMFAIYLASVVTKRASKKAESKNKRGLYPMAIVDELSNICEDISPLK